MTTLSQRPAVAARPAMPQVGRRRRQTGPVVLVLRIVLALIYGVPVLWIFVTSLKGQGDVLSPW